MRWAPFVALTTLLGSTSPTSAQDDQIARLRARVSAAPSDASAQCQLSFALVSAERFEEATRAAEAGIAVLGSAPAPATRRTLGACLYNLGRAQEGLGHRAEFIPAYVESLRVRPNPIVLARLQAAVLDTPSEYPAAALLALDVEGSAPLDALGQVQLFETPATGRGAQRIVWRLVALSRMNDSGYTDALLYVIAEVPGAPIVWRRLDRWTTEESGGTSFDVARVSPLRATTPGSGAALEGLVVQAHAGGGGACGAMDGFADLEHDVTILLAYDRAARRVRSRALVTRELSCGEPIRMPVRISGGDVVVARSRHGDLEPGTYPISSLLR